MDQEHREVAQGAPHVRAMSCKQARTKRPATKLFPHLLRLLGENERQVQCF
jgi:hypothetical protein